MSERLPFEVIFDELVLAHFAVIERKDHALILDTIAQQLVYEPNLQTRNRKPLRIPNSLNATWELRCGMNNRYRLFYDIDLDNRLVILLAVGRKQGNRLMVGKEEIEV
ncbi:MAG: hypothetical protein K1X65_05930 [Caldilineales bacterium]|nr:hypothetical protein [Caldilineales bacterium]MCW5856913.1 hypothetical protein [Caldilineales bacterium]